MHIFRYLFLLIMLPGPVWSVAQQTEIQYLSGLDKDKTVDWEFFCSAGRKSGSWTTIPVPSQWELQGFGTYNFGHDPNPAKEEGKYRHRFRIPKDWKNKQVYIVFEGVMTDTKVRVNGQSAGPVHQGGFYQFEYDITDLLCPGKSNLLEVDVAKYSADETVNDAERRADYWIFGGIFRPVYLKAMPRLHIHRMAIDAKADGRFAVDVFVEGIDQASQIEAKIFGSDGRQFGETIRQSAGSGVSLIHLTHQFSQPKSWSPEFPHMYEIQLNLMQRNKLVHTHREGFGFRTVELRKRDGIYVNGKRIMFKGVNRHSFWPSSGRTTSKALSIQDVNLMKDMNMNAVRMSHYPPDTHFLDVCDSLGLFVLDELAGWQQEYGTEPGRKLVRELVIRDVNHPSVVIWDNGNEGGNNFELVDEFAKYDPQNRIVIHPWNQFRGTDTYHYKSYDCCNNSFFHSKEVFFPTEFLHGLYDGGHGAGLEDYWTLMKQKRLSAGGFLWVFSDEAVLRTDKDRILDSDGNHAPDGILGPYREKEGSFYAIKDIWSPIQIQDFPLTQDFKGQIPLNNEFIYTNLFRCRFKWELIKYWGMGNKDPVLASGYLDGPDIAPGEKGKLHLPIESILKDNAQKDRPEFLALEAWDPNGRQIYRWTWALHQAAEQEEIAHEMADFILSNDHMLPQQKGSFENDSVFSVSSRLTKYRFDLKTGLLTDVQVEGQNISLGEGPLPVGIGQSMELDTVKLGDDEGYLSFHFKGDLQTLRYRVHDFGWLEIIAEYLPGSDAQYPGVNLDYAGIGFNFPEEKVKDFQFIGRGPYRVWKNRMRGVEYGLWQKDYNNTVTGESWDYPEFKGYHANFLSGKLTTTEGNIQMIMGSDDIFLHLFTPDPPNEGKNQWTVPAFPKTDLSFLHAIPPIGTKFKAPENLGPQGNINLFYQPGRHYDLFKIRMWLKFEVD